MAATLACKADAEDGGVTPASAVSAELSGKMRGGGLLGLFAVFMGDHPTPPDLLFAVFLRLGLLLSCAVLDAPGACLSLLCLQRQC